jgi:hypothetical protein
LLVEGGGQRGGELRPPLGGEHLQGPPALLERRAAAAHGREVAPGRLGVAKLLRDFHRQLRDARLGLFQPCEHRRPTRRGSQVHASLKSVAHAFEKAALR